MEYPEESYWDNFVPGISLTRQKTFLVERAYDMGKADAKNLDGYSNLTDAISTGEPIDYEKLDGFKVQLVHPEMGTLHGTLKRDKRCAPDSFYGWWDGETDCVYARALCPAWDGQNGWSLWVEGEIPLHRKTADQLEVGTYFRGESGQKLYVGEEIDSSKIVRHVPKMEESLFDPSEWVVLEEYGPFPFPDTQ